MHKVQLWASLQDLNISNTTQDPSILAPWSLFPTASLAICWSRYGVRVLTSICNSVRKKKTTDSPLSVNSGRTPRDLDLDRIDTICIFRSRKMLGGVSAQFVIAAAWVKDQTQNLYVMGRKIPPRLRCFTVKFTYMLVLQVVCCSWFV